MSGAVVVGAVGGGGSVDDVEEEEGATMLTAAAAVVVEVVVPTLNPLHTPKEGRHDAATQLMHAGLVWSVAHCIKQLVTTQEAICPMHTEHVPL